MSEQSQGPGWWQASDGRWYPPEAAPGPTTPAADPAGTWGSSASPTAWGAPPAGYGYAYGPGGPAWGAPPLPSANGLAVASLVLGIIGIIPCFWNMVCAIVALVLGIVAVRRMNAGTHAPDGKGMAIAGIVLGGLGTVLLLLLFFLLVLGSTTDTSMAGLGTWS